MVAVVSAIESDVKGESQEDEDESESTTFSWTHTASLDIDNSELQSGLSSSVDIKHQVTKDISVEVGLELNMDLVQDRESGSTEIPKEFSIGDTLIAKEFVGDAYSIRTTLGRQSLSDDTGWWWDDSLEALQFVAQTDDWSANIGVGRSFSDTSGEVTGLADDEKPALLLGGVGYDWSDDHSVSAHIFQPVRFGDQKDDDDVRISWYGLGIAGQWTDGGQQRTSYRLDLAAIDGQMTVENDEDDEDELGAVSEPMSASGWAADMAIDHKFDLPLSPTVSAGIALTSKGDVTAPGHRKLFRQTGLQANEVSIGNSSIDRYGSVASPELSNLRVLSLVSSFDLNNGGNLAFAYHKYEQRLASDTFNSSLDDDPDGESIKLGQAFEISAELPHNTTFGDNATVSLSAGVFEKGSAFGEQRGERIYSVGMSFELEF